MHLKTWNFLKLRLVFNKVSNVQEMELYDRKLTNNGLSPLLTWILESRGTVTSFLLCCNIFKVFNIVLVERSTLSDYPGPKNLYSEFWMRNWEISDAIAQCLRQIFSFITLWTSMMFWVLFISFLHYRREKRKIECHRWITRTIILNFICKDANSPLYSTLVNPLLTFYFIMFLPSYHALTKHYKGSRVLTHKTVCFSYYSNCWKDLSSLK